MASVFSLFCHFLHALGFLRNVVSGSCFLTACVSPATESAGTYSAQVRCGVSSGEQQSSLSDLAGESFHPFFPRRQDGLDCQAERRNPRGRKEATRQASLRLCRKKNAPKKGNSDERRPAGLDRSVRLEYLERGLESLLLLRSLAARHRSGAGLRN